MWEQYKRTLIGMQLLITGVTALVFVATHFWMHAVVFYLVMQLGSALGSLWGARLRRKIQERRSQCPTLDG